MPKSNVLEFKRPVPQRNDEYLTLMQIIERGCSGSEAIQIKRLMLDPNPGSNETRTFSFFIYAYVVTNTELLAYIYSHEGNTFCLEWNCDLSETIPLIDQVAILDNDIIDSFEGQGEAIMSNSLMSDLWPEFWPSC